MRKSSATRRRRRENIITAMLIAGMAVVVGSTVVFALRYDNIMAYVNSRSAGSVGQTEVAAAELGRASSAIKNAIEPTKALAAEVVKDNAIAKADDLVNQVSRDEQTIPASNNTIGESEAEERADDEDDMLFKAGSGSKTSPTPTPKTSGKLLKKLDDYKPGDVIDKKLIDMKNLGKYFTSAKIKKGDAVYKRINGKSYKKNKNISLSSLRYLKMLHVNFNGQYQVGEMIVNKKVESNVRKIFKNLFEQGYQIEKMYLIDNYWKGTGSKSDWNSIDHNNTSAFCYREATGSGKLSKHALGLAIDINPQQNPYVTFKNGKPQYSHSNATKYVTNRSSKTPHVITKKDKAYKLFKKYGWTWGGSWSSPKDYQHFQTS